LRRSRGGSGRGRAFDLSDRAGSDAPGLLRARERGPLRQGGGLDLHEAEPAEEPHEDVRGRREGEGVDPVDGGEAMSQRLSSTLVDAFMQFCQGNFAYRLPRTYARDDADTEAFFFNSVAAELERIVMDARRQEERLREVTERLSAALLRVAAGDLDVRLERDGKGDAVDVLLYLVNNTIAELAHLVRERERAAALEMERLNQLVEARTAQLRELAVTDALTGAMNRRRLFEVAEAMHAESERYGRPFGLAMLDLDRFKRINDEFGHAVGDRA